MPLEINQEQVIVKKKVVSFKHLTIGRAPDGAKFAEVVFDIKDETGTVIDMFVKSYQGQDFNTWWNAFNSGTVLYNDVCIEKGLPLPGLLALESEFVNS